MRLDKTKSLIVVIALGLVGLCGWAVWDFYQFSLRKGPGNGAVLLTKNLKDRVDRAMKAKESARGPNQWGYQRPEEWAVFWKANFIGKEPPPPATAPASQPVAVERPKLHIPIGEVAELLTVFTNPGQEAGPTGFVILEYRKPVEEAVALDRGTPSGAAGAAVLTRQLLGTGETLRRPFEAWILKEVLADGSGAAFVWDGKDREELKLAELVPESLAADESELKAWAPGEGPAASRPGRTPGAAARPVPSPAGAKGWIPVKGNKPQKVAENDWSLPEEVAREFGDAPDRWLESVRLGAVSLPEGAKARHGGQQTGVAVGKVSGKAAELGIEEGMILISLNGEPIATKTELINVGKRLYNRGVRVFQAVVLHYNREQTLTYRVPDSR